MSDRACARVAAFAVSAVLILIALSVLLAWPVRAHEQMGTFSGGFLYGQRIGGDPDYPINCCRYQGDGDCRLVEETDVKIVSGGYLLSDGEFISHADTTVSPLDADGEYRYWRCRHAGQPSHCFFSPPRGQ